MSPLFILLFSVGCNHCLLLHDTATKLLYSLPTFLLSLFHLLFSPFLFHHLFTFFFVFSTSCLATSPVFTSLTSPFLLTPQLCPQFQPLAIILWLRFSSNTSSTFSSSSVLSFSLYSSLPLLIPGICSFDLAIIFAPPPPRVTMTEKDRELFM